MAGQKPGSCCHIEIPTASRENAKKFYGRVFGWTFQDVPEMSYTLFSTGDGEVGGGFWNPPPEIPRLITNYLTVEDVDAKVAQVQEHGGKLLKPKMVVGNFGCFALVADPDGNVLGLWQRIRASRPPAKKAAAKRSAGKTGKKRR